MEYRRRTGYVQVELEDLARFRQAAYRVLSSMLLYPRAQRISTISAAAQALHEQSDALSRFAFFPQWKRLLLLLANLAKLPTVALEEEYVRIFMHGFDSTSCLPYESVYIDPTGQAAGWLMASLEREYRLWGMTISSSAKELPDHAAVELEFMAHLCGKEADGWDRKALQEAVQVLEGESEFLNQHLCRWLPILAKKVRDADREGVYATVAETARAFVSHDKDLISILLPKLRTT